MKSLKSCATLALWIAGTSAGVSQTTVFDIDAYRQFLASHQNLSTADLQAMHPAGSYGASIPAPGSAPMYLDTISAKCALTPFELEQIGKHGFVVSSRLSENTFVQALEAIYLYLANNEGASRGAVPHLQRASRTSHPRELPFTPHSIQTTRTHSTARQSCLSA